MIRYGLLPDLILVFAALVVVGRFVALGAFAALPLAAISAIVVVALARQLRMYRNATSDTRQSTQRRAAITALLGAGLFLTIMYVVDVDHDRRWLPVAAVTVFLVLSHRRDLVRTIDRWLPGERVLADRILLMGDLTSCVAFETSGSHGDFKVIDRFEIAPEHAEVRKTIRVTDAAVDMAKEGHVDRIVLLTSSLELPVVNAVVRRCTLRNTTVDLLTGAARITQGRLEVGRVNAFATLNVRPGLNGRRQKVAKRAFDLVLTSLLVVVLSPVMVALALAVKFDSEGPVLYRQSRLGRGGGQFEMLKFRSMVDNAHKKVVDLRDENEGSGPLFKMKNDPRVTRVGRFIRRTSLDELPQLFNVLRGQMSLVGPRPALPDEADSWPIELFDRLEVLPGITGLWQVSGRSDISFTEYEQLDLYYVDNWSMRLDVSILARTLPAAVSSDGAY